MSFRARLTLFFVLIVALPIIALAVLVSQIAADSASGKVDARLSAGLKTATNVFEQAQQESALAANRLARQVAAGSASAQELREGRLRALATRLGAEPEIAVVRISQPSGDQVTIGPGTPVAAASVELTDAGARLGTLTVSTVTSSELLDRVEQATDEDAALVGPNGPLTGTVPIETSALPDSGDAATLDSDGGEVRVAATEPLGDEQARIALFAPPGGEGFLSSRPSVAIALAVFLLLAILAIGLLLRVLQRQIKEMLAAARRIGGGDFSGQVPVSGNDEMADLASEFNKMSGQLSEQMDQLRRQREEIDKSVRRVGQAFASGLDRQALLAILVETAVGTCEADYGLVALSGHVGAEADAGTGTDQVQEIALAAEQRALREAGPVEVELGGAHAFASALGRIGQTATPVGAMTIARAGRPFSAGEREVFLYLVGQAAASVENVALHELVSEQAVTDDLTGLANNRAFHDLMDREAARAHRFGHDLSLLILDIDDFKRVNDTYGHPQGDAVLKAIGRALTAESREIDFPARYGGEEFAVVLPETDSVGAVELGDRIRERIASEPVELLDGSGGIEVTASLGAATLPGEAADVRELVAAADKALYEAKRSGKNRTVAAPSRDLGSAVAVAETAATAAKGPAPRRRK